MPTADVCIKKYGKDIWERMCNSGWLDGITVTLLPNGEIDVPQRDIDIAYRAIMGDEIHEWEWD